MFKKKSKSKEAPLPRSSSGSAYYLSRKEINGLMEQAEEQPPPAKEPAGKNVEPERRSLVIRSGSAETGDALGELQAGATTFTISSQGLQLKPTTSDPEASREESAPVFDTPADGKSAKEEQPAAKPASTGGLFSGLLASKRSPARRPSSSVATGAQQGPGPSLAAGVPEAGTGKLDTLDSLLLKAGQESRTGPEQRTLFSIPVKAGNSREKMDELHSLQRNAESLCAKLHALSRLCTSGPPDAGGARMASPRGGAVSVDSFLFVGGQILPEQQKLRAHLAKKFPEHPRQLNLEKVDRQATEVIFGASKAIQDRLEPWCHVLVDLMTFTEHAIMLLDELSKKLIAFLPESNDLVMESFLDLFVSVVRVNILADRVPRKVLLQVHALAHYNNSRSSDSPVDPSVFSFVAVYENPVLALQRDLERVSPRVGEVLDSIAPQVLSLLNIDAIRLDGVLSPWPKDGYGAPIDLLPAQAQYNASPAAKREALSTEENTPVRSRLAADAIESRALDFGALHKASVDAEGVDAEKGDQESGPAVARVAPEEEMSQLALDETDSIVSGSWAASPFPQNPASPQPPVPGERRSSIAGKTAEQNATVDGSDHVVPDAMQVDKERTAGATEDADRESIAGGVAETAAEGGEAESQPAAAGVAQPSDQYVPTADFSQMRLSMGGRESWPQGEGLQPQGLRGLEAHLQGVLYGFLACPTELARGQPGSDLRARLIGAVLGQTFLVPLFRNECVYIHEEYAQYVLPRLAELEKQAKSRKGEVDEELRAAKAAKRAIKNAADVVSGGCGPFHRERRVILHQELERMATAFVDVPGLLPQKIQNVLGALSLARAELHWHFHHLGAPSKSRAGKVPIGEDVPDPTVGALLSVTQQLAGIVKEYRTAVRSHAAAKLLEARSKVHFFSGLAAAGLDLDNTLKRLLTSLAPSLEEEYLKEVIKGGSASGKLQAFQQTWVAALGLLSNAKSSVNLRHLELATSQGMVPGLARECNRAFQLARCVDELDVLLEESSSLKILHFYQPKLLLVLQQTLYDPVGFPEDACSWLRLADSFPQNAHKSVPQELPQLAVAAVEYIENVLEFLMGGLQSMVAALDSESGWAGLDRQISSERAVLRLNHTAQLKSGKRRSSSKKDELLLSQRQPGHESDPAALEVIRSIEAAVQRLTSFVAELGTMAPVKVLDRVYAPREYLRERLHAIIKTRLQDNYLAGLKAFRPPQLLEDDLRRFEAILQLIGRHVSIDVTRVLREVLLSEAYTDRMRDLQPPASKKDVLVEGPKAVAAVVAEWYIDFIVTDLRNAGIVYSQSTTGFTSLNHSSATVEQVTRVEAFHSLLRVFGPYGADRLVAKTLEITVLAITTLESILRENQAALQELQANFHLPEKRTRLLTKISGIENVYALTTQIGQCIALRESVAEACANVMKQHAPLIHTVLGDAVRCLPPPVLPEGVHAARLRRVAQKVGAGDKADVIDPLVYNALQSIGKVGDVTWRLLPVLWAVCTGSSSWKTAHFDARTDAFSNNAHCFAKGLQTLLSCCERVGFERRELQYQLESARIKMLTSEGGGIVEPTETDEASDVSTGSPLSEVVRGQMSKYVAFTVALTLTDWDGRGSPGEIRPVMTKLIFLDQLCEMSPHLSRSSLEQHVPHTLLRSIYQAEYTLQALPVNTPTPAAVQSGRSSLSMMSRNA